MKWLREPLVHFLLLGAGLFGFFAFVGHRSSERTGQIVVTPGQIESLAVSFTRTWQRPPTEQELNGLIEDYIREEVLYREAVAMGLDRDDTIIRRRLRQKLEFLTEDAAETTPSDQELQAFLQKNPDAFREEPRLSFRHVYLSPERRGVAAAADARQLLARLTTWGPTTNIGALGDPLLLPPEFGLTRRGEIAGLFGEAFATQLLQVEPGRWAGPLESAYGLHLVLVRERTEGRVPELAEIRESVEREWLAARRKQVMEAAYQKLRGRYTVVVERPNATSDNAPKTAEKR